MVQAFMKFRAKLLAEIESDSDWAKVQATGNAKRFLQSEQSYQIKETLIGAQFTQWGVGYTNAIDKGSKPNRPTFASIYDWVGLKKYGISFANPKEQRGITFAILKNMEKQGSYKFRTPSKQSNIFAGAVQRSLPTLYEGVENATVASVGSEIEGAIDGK
jgi:hypothetical protein